MDNIPKIEHRDGVISVKKQQRSSRLLILEVKTKVAFQDFKISRFQDFKISRCRDFKIDNCCLQAIHVLAVQVLEVNSLMEADTTRLQCEKRG